MRAQRSKASLSKSDFQILSAPAPSEPLSVPLAYELHLKGSPQKGPAQLFLGVRRANSWFPAPLTVKKIITLKTY